MNKYQKAFNHVFGNMYIEIARQSGKSSLIESINIIRDLVEKYSMIENFFTNNKTNPIDMFGVITKEDTIKEIIEIINEEIEGYQLKNNNPIIHERILFANNLTISALERLIFIIKEKYNIEEKKDDE